MWAKERGVQMNTTDANAGLPRSMMYGLTALIIAGCGLFLFGAAGEPQRIWANLLVASYCILILGLGAAVWLALFNVTGARWSEVIRPTVERLTWLLPVGAIGMVMILVAAPSLYPWTHEAGETGSAFQALWLSRPFLLLRAFLCVALWFGLVFLLVQSSRRNDDSRVRVSAVFLVVFAITFWLASVDWIMSLEPKWSSTIFGVYHFAGMFVAALAAIIVVAVWSGRLTNQPTPHGTRLTGDLGTLLFSFSSFWAYAWFCQYLLIWYVNNPEETEYFVLRQNDAWHPLFLANVVLNWGVPFVVLLFQRAKESPHVLLGITVVILLGRWLDLYLMVLPPVVSGGPMIGDAGLFAATMGLAALIVGCPCRLAAKALKV